MSEINEIMNLLKKHEKRITNLENLISSKSSPLRDNGEKVLTDLVSSGFFDTKKKLGDITKELKTQAKFDISHKYKEILEKLTRDDKLTRKMSGHQWMYSKK